MKNSTSVIRLPGANGYTSSDWLENKLSQNQMLFMGRVKDTIGNLTKIPWMRCKLMIVGQGRAGKSALVRSLVGESFDPGLESTVGASLKKTRTAANDGAWGEISSTKQEEYLSAAVAKAVVKAEIASRAKDKKSTKETKKKSLALKIGVEGNRKVAESGRFEIGKAGNPGAPLMKDEDIARKFDHKLIARSKAQQDTLEFTIWDYGGQKVFYALHHLFLTDFGVYTLVFDMRNIIQSSDESLEYMKFWLNSVKMHAREAPLLIVGTHLDSIDASQLKVVDKHLRKLVNKSRFPQVIYNSEDLDLVFFPVSNLNRAGINEVRKKLDEVAFKQRFVNEKIPVRWIKCLDMMFEDESASFIYMKDVRTLGKTVEITSMEEIDMMLQLFHDLGMIIHFTSTPTLNDIVTLSPQWLIDGLSKIIRDRELHKYNAKKIRDVGLEDEVQKMFEEAIVSLDLMEYFWEHNTVEFLIDLMKRTLLISDWAFDGQHDGNSFFLVPSLLHEQKNTNQNQKPTNVHRCSFDFSSSWLPNGVFQRLVCLCVAHSANQKGSQRPKLDQSNCKVWFGSDEVGLQQDGDQILVSVADAKTASRYYGMLKSMLFKINSDTMKSGLEWNLFFEANVNGTRSWINHDDAKKQELSPWFDKSADDLKKGDVEGSLVKNTDLNVFLDSL
uniref:non-specific serine/threonine protein kinase n=1 Tax=Aplanochytrium stocchinoi TaxID=215587 RepID=A0A6S8E7N8_9STRA